MFRTSQYFINVFTRFVACLPVVSLLLFLFSCDYESHEKYLKKIPEQDLSNLSITLSNTTNDTLYLFGKANLNYSAFLNGRKTYVAYVYMDGVQIQTLNSGSAFVIDAHIYEIGRHLLKLEIYASAGTGTLGDVVGAEQLKLTKEWVAYLDNSPPEAVDFTSVGISDGSMHIQWKRYPKFNFTAYVVEKQYWNQSYDSYSTCWQKEIPGKDVISLRDSTYLGGKVRYRIRIKAGELFSPYVTKDFEYVYDPVLAFEWVDREQVRVAWHRPLIAHSFKDYEVAFRFSDRKVITSIADTAVVFKPEISFGQIASFSLTVHPKGGRCEGGESLYTRISLGDVFPQFTGSEIAYCRDNDKYYSRKYADNEYYLVRIDGKTGTIEQTMLLDGKFTISPNGKYLYISYDNVLRQLDPLTFAIIKTHNLYELSDVNTSIAGNFTASDNQLISLATYDSNYVVKMPDFEVVYSSAGNHSIGMSPLGNTMVSDGKLWRWTGAAFTATHTFSNSFHPMFKDDNTLIKIYYNSKISIQNLSTFEETSVQLPPNTDVITYDPVSDMIGYTEESSSYASTTPFHLIDMQAGNAKTFTVAQLDNHRGEHIFLINNQILCSRGFSIPLSYYYP